MNITRFFYRQQIIVPEYNAVSQELWKIISYKPLYKSNFHDLHEVMFPGS